MNGLEQARLDINDIDKEMAVLFERRMRAVARVLEYKRRSGMEIFDPSREAEVIEKGLSRLENSRLSPYYRSFIISVMDISKQYQRELLEKEGQI